MSEELLKNLSDYLALLGGLTFWLGFLALGLVAKRYETVFRKSTAWLFLALAPSGVLLYALLVVVRISETGMVEKLVAYFALALSGLLCLAGAARFHGVLTMLVKGGKR